MKYKIGIFGSADGNTDVIIKKAHELGEVLGKKDVILITGVSMGLPNEVALTAKKSGAEIWGYSQATSLEIQQKYAPDCDFGIYSRIIYIPHDYAFASDRLVCMKYRNVTSTANCDAGIIISGRWGSLNEFTNLYDMGKVIGVLTGTGGVADELENLSKKISKKSKAVILFDSSPEKLVEKILNELKNKV